MLNLVACAWGQSASGSFGLHDVTESARRLAANWRSVPRAPARPEKLALVVPLLCATMAADFTFGANACSSRIVRAEDANDAGSIPRSKPHGKHRPHERRILPRQQSRP